MTDQMKAPGGTQPPSGDLLFSSAKGLRGSIFTIYGNQRSGRRRRKKDEEEDVEELEKLEEEDDEEEDAEAEEEESMHIHMHIRKHGPRHLGLRSLP